VLVLEIREGRVQGVYVVGDRSKLTHLPAIDDAP
jgi:hypothetical protein